MSENGRPSDGTNRLRTRLRYHSIINHLHDDRLELTDLKSQGLEKLMKDCDEVFTAVRTPREGVLDAKAVTQMAKLANTRIKSVGYEGSFMRAEEFALKCKHIIIDLSTESVTNLTSGWSDFYAQFAPLASKLPFMPSIMAGRLPLSSDATKALAAKKRTITRRAPQKYETVAEEPEQLKTIDNTSGEGTSKEVVRLAQCLWQSWLDGNSKPVSFFEFVTHPTNFARTVENIFHTTFMVKERMALLRHDEDSLPVLIPVKALKELKETKKKLSGKRSRSDDEDDEDDDEEEDADADLMDHDGQCILSITMDAWENIKASFDIQKPLIPDIDKQ